MLEFEVDRICEAFVLLGAVTSPNLIRRGIICAGNDVWVGELRLPTKMFTLLGGSFQQSAEARPRQRGMPNAVAEVEVGHEEQLVEESVSLARVEEPPVGTD